MTLSVSNSQEHQLEHWKQAVGGHKKECRRLKADKEAADAVAAAELARLSLSGAGPSRAAGPSPSSRGGRSAAQRGGSRGAAGAGDRGAVGGSGGDVGSRGGIQQTGGLVD